MFVIYVYSTYVQLINITWPTLMAPKSTAQMSGTVADTWPLL